MCWSPDESKFFYVSDVGSDHVLDIATGKDLALPIQGTTLNQTIASLLWPSPDEVIATYSEGTLLTLNLDTLTTTMGGSDRDKNAKLFRSSRAHKTANITALDLSRLRGNGSFLVVQNNDGTAITPLVPNVRVDAWLTVEPSLHTVLLLGRDEVQVVFMKTKVPGPYQWGFSLPPQQSNSQLAKYISKGVPFHAKVFAPAYNPLNGKMVGIDRQRFKGWVMIKEWNGLSHVTATTRIEFNPISEGDIVTDISSEQRGDFGNHPFDFGDYWTSVTNKSPSQSTASLPFDTKDTNKQSFQKLIIGGWNHHTRFTEYFEGGRYVNHPRRGKDESGKWLITENILTHTSDSGQVSSNKIVSLNATELALGFGEHEPTLYFSRSEGDAGTKMSPVGEKAKADSTLEKLKEEKSQLEKKLEELKLMEQSKSL
jgi:hypothetical protein